MATERADSVAVEYLEFLFYISEVQASNRTAKVV
jgi:hypothetical protein